MKRPALEVYQDRKGEWRWRLKAANGRIVADSGEGYTRRQSAVRAGDRVVSVAAEIDTARKVAKLGRAVIAGAATHRYPGAIERNR